MSVTYISPIEQQSGDLGTKNSFTAERSYTVETSSLSDDEVTVISYVASNVAAMYSQHPNYLYSFVTGISASRNTDDGLTWTATISYGPLDEDDADENPLNKPVQWEDDWQIINKLIDVDQNDERITNSTGDPPVEAIEIPVGQLVINATRNVAPHNYDRATIAAYSGATNSDNWQGFSPGQAQFLPGKVSREYDAKYGAYYVVPYQFVINTDKHVPLKLLDQGYRVLDDGDPIFAVDKEGEKISDPILLNGLGEELGVDLPPVFLEYYHLRRLPFNDVFNF